MTKWAQWEEDLGAYLSCFCYTCKEPGYNVLNLLDKDAMLGDVIVAAEKHAQENPGHHVHVTIDGRWRVQG